MSFFDKAEEATEEIATNKPRKNENGLVKKKKDIRTASNLGRAITSIKSAKSEIYREHDRVNPIPHIEEAVRTDKTFYGFYHNGDKEGEPFFLKNSATTHEIYVGSTGTGKGVYLANKTSEAMRKKVGVIVVDPKKDVFLPQVIQDQLERQGRPEDFQIVSWADNFGYTGINEFDTYKDIANKFIDALDLTPSDNQGVDYYRKNGRVMLNKILKLFFDGSLGVIVKKDFSDILFHIKALKEDLEKQVLLEKEIGKMKPNANLIEKYNVRFYQLEKIEAIYWDTTAIDTLDSLVKSVGEIAEGADIFKKFDLSGALYEGKVLYMRVDMLDVASLKMVKMMITDAIQQARRKEANTMVILDELSFYANETISGGLATVRSMGLKFILALQDLSQMKEPHIRNAIMSNCNVKLFYKISDPATFDYVLKNAGVETVSAYSLGVDGEIKISQQTEDAMNNTRIRAMPRAGVAILIAEELNETHLIKTNFVRTVDDKKFDWQPHEIREESQSYFDELDLDDEELYMESDDEKIARYKISMEESSLLENSDISGISYSSEKIGE